MNRRPARALLCGLLIWGVTTAPAQGAHPFNCGQVDVTVLGPFYLAYYDGFTAEHNPLMDYHIYAEANATNGLQGGGTNPAGFHGAPCPADYPDLHVY